MNVRNPDITGPADHLLDRRRIRACREHFKNMPTYPALTGEGGYCKVDASYSPIEVGDMLTTSATPGCAMKACDPARAFGAVIGKALACVDSGTALIPVLVTLQ